MLSFPSVVFLEPLLLFGETNRNLNTSHPDSPPLSATLAADVGRILARRYVCLPVDKLSAKLIPRFGFEAAVRRPAAGSEKSAGVSDGATRVALLKPSKVKPSLSPDNKLQLDLVDLGNDQPSADGINYPFLHLRFCGWNSAR